MKKYFVSFWCPSYISRSDSYCGNSVIEFQEIKNGNDVVNLEGFLQKENANTALALLGWHVLESN
ncbi:hypothetical protein A3J61_00880 [Candidatus Nomurabacteria bacterium RIFCSPHIGHO2_02_FULL_38_15]|uniref:Uncharacterized protein n=1 Tax=Candidatus Nomurabacteria bacterium RIFCSPHIGHO2_02_FULL_38_15 TaxID=1801752 RepID=A0A1F6VS35_9BACT|nr:MAG: hypothetical protein A3J61_00880 [Candidatus Nomurabacteria bacterium RIFCSPHIGHO2_02_FULL_38_15]